MNENKIILPGGAGLVGQNLIARFRTQGYSNIVVLDKHRANLAVLKKVQPDITVEFADLAEPGDWLRHFDGAEVVVMLQAQIGGNYYQEFVRNNLNSTQLILDAIKANKVPYLVHISSSVIESAADDFYTRWFDRKHLGWLSRFMQKVPIFPIPGLGRYMRQPLYVGDFCEIIISCIENRVCDGVYNISGHEKVDYIDIIRAIKQATQSRTPIVRIPYNLFYLLLWTWALFDKNPPFTTQQLAALSTKDEFEVIDWPGIFGVPYTPFQKAVDETFNDPRYSSIALEF
ncbi:MAG: NAD-dependent epimerase/dehydratase family protein [Desulfobulbaceae bacterium]|nr:NAD-dependent epimerase/dehydratase family protein [Desulfobulbaceae bacterium]